MPVHVPSGDSAGAAVGGIPAIVSFRDLFLSLFAHTSLGAGVADRRGHLIWSNKALQAMLGYSAEELASMSFAEFTHPDDAPSGLEAVQGLLAGRIDQFQQEKRYLAKDGRVIWGRVTVSAAWPTNDPDILGLVVIEDITQRREVEKVLEASEQRYRVLFEQNLDGVLMTMPDGRITDANAAACRMLQMSVEEIRAAGRAGLLQPDPAHADMVRARDLVGRVQGDVTFIRKDGSTFLAEFSSATVPKAAGGPQAFVIFRDTTERKLAIEALQSANDRLGLAQRASGSGVWDWDMLTGTLVWSPEFRVLFGLPADAEASFGTWRAVLHPDDLEGAEARINSAVADHVPLENEYRIIRPDGEVIWIGAAGSTSYDEAGRPLRMLGVCTDITARKKTEESLRRANRALKTISECNQLLVRAPDEATLLDGICRLLVEHGGYRMSWIGFAQQDEAKTVGPVAYFGFEEGYLDTINVTWADEERGRGPTGTAIRTGRPTLARNIAGDPDNDSWRAAAIQRGYASSISLPLHDGRRSLGALNLYAAQPDAFDADEVNLLTELANDLAYGIGALRYQAERERAEEALRESDERFRILFEHAPMGYQSMDEEGRLLTVNLAWLETLGYRREEVVGRWFGDFLAPEAVDTFRERFSLFKAQGKTHTEFHMLHKDGSRRLISFEGRIGYNLDGSFRQTHCIIQDITERTHAEQERLDLERQLQHSQKLESLGVLAGGIAHDFNNILMAVLGNADLALAALSPSAPARKNLLEITQASHRATELCRQMLAYSGRGQFVIEPMDLGALVEDMLDLLRSTISKKALLDMHLEKDLPSLLGDASQLSQVIMNLVINASEAIGDESGVITISTGVAEYSREHLCGGYLAPDLPPGRYLALEVSDTGVGMDIETQERIFEPFFTSKFTGRGLGLSAVLGIVRGHKGGLRVTSEPGKGSSFKLVFPAADAKARAAHREGEAISSPWRGEGTVLLVDDEKTILAVGTHMLEHLGFRVLVAADGREALETYGKHRDEITLVLLDFTMPYMDGSETFRELRRLDPDVRVMISSGYPEQDVISRFAGEDLAGFVPKPYTMDLLRERIRVALGTETIPPMCPPKD